MMIRRGSRRWAWGLIALLALPAPGFAQDPKSPTPEEYVAHAGGETTIIPAGKFKLDGIELYCGTRPIDGAPCSPPGLRSRCARASSRPRRRRGGWSTTFSSGDTS